MDTDNLLLLAPRRVGKTSLLYRLLDTAESNDFSAIYLSVSDKNSELSLVEALYNVVAKHSKGKQIIAKFRKSLEKISKVQLPMGIGVEFTPEHAKHWAILAQTLVETISELDGAWLIMIDELPIFVMNLLRADQTKTRARNFLNWFRELRIGPEASDNIRWILCGSIGLDTVAARYGLGDTINDLYLFALGAFEEKVAKQFPFTGT